MSRLRSLSVMVLSVLALSGVLACDAKAPTSPAPPPVPGTTTSVVAGVVLNAQTRQPISGAVVTLNAQAVAPSIPTATTAVDGSFRIESVVIGPRVVRVEAEGYQPYSQDLNIGSVEVRTEITLAPSAPLPPPPPTTTTVGGFITSRQTSLPINGATISFTLTTGERFTANTTVDGQFVLNNVPVGAVGDLRVEASGHRAEVTRVTVEPNLFVTVGLDQGSE